VNASHTRTDKSSHRQRRNSQSQNQEKDCHCVVFRRSYHHEPKILTVWIKISISAHKSINTSAHQHVYIAHPFPLPFLRIIPACNWCHFRNRCWYGWMMTTALSHRRWSKLEMSFQQLVPTIVRVEESETTNEARIIETWDLGNYAIVQTFHTIELSLRSISILSTNYYLQGGLQIERETKKRNDLAGLVSPDKTWRLRAQCNVKIVQFRSRKRNRNLQKKIK
jgi:hypothetical protein